MAKTRTFIAVEAVDEVHGKALSAIDQLRPTGSGIKWVAPENLHWTLQFLGELTDEEIAEVCLRVVRIAEDVEPFTLAAYGVGAFPSIQRPKTLWVGAREGAEQLQELQGAIEQSLTSLGFRGEQRKFVPHLTLGRVGRGGAVVSELSQRLSELDDFAGGWMAVDEVTVFASELQKSGPSYYPLAHARLAPNS